MPDMTDQTNAAIAWLSTNGVVLAIVAIAALLLYRWTRPAIHRVLVRVMQAQAATLGDSPVLQAETDKRVETIEELLAKLLRLGVVVGVIVVVLGVFDLWSALAGLGLIIAAITLAGQSIILDYLMGILILLEAQYFKGDIVRVGTVQGSVEEVGLRRTVIRDNRGVVHSISNGLIRESSNLTRTYAVATVDIDGIADRDVEAMIQVLDAVGQQIAADPDLADRLLDTPAYAGTIRLSAAGATLRLQARVQPDARIGIETEMRRRVAAGMAAQGIEAIRPSVVAPPTTR